jgi:hypothetical protein
MFMVGVFKRSSSAQLGGGFNGAAFAYLTF